MTGYMELDRGLRRGTQGYVGRFKSGTSLKVSAPGVIHYSSPKHRLEQRYVFREIVGRFLERCAGHVWEDFQGI